MGRRRRLWKGRAGKLRRQAVSDSGHEGCERDVGSPSGECRAVPRSCDGLCRCCVPFGQASLSAWRCFGVFQPTQPLRPVLSRKWRVLLLWLLLLLSHGCMGALCSELALCASLPLSSRACGNRAHSLVIIVNAAWALLVHCRSHLVSRVSFRCVLLLILLYRIIASVLSSRRPLLHFVTSTHRRPSSHRKCHCCTGRPIAQFSFVSLVTNDTFSSSFAVLLPLLPSLRGSVTSQTGTLGEDAAPRPLKRGDQPLS